MTHVTCRLTATNRDQLRIPIRSVVEFGYLIFYLFLCMWQRGGESVLRGAAGTRAGISAQRRHYLQRPQTREPSPRLHRIPQGIYASQARILTRHGRSQVACCLYLAILPTLLQEVLKVVSADDMNVVPDFSEWKPEARFAVLLYHRWQVQFTRVIHDHSTVS